MVDFIEHRRERGFDIRKIHHPSGMRLWLTLDVDFHTE